MSKKKEIKITHDEWLNELIKPPTPKPEDAFTITEMLTKTTIKRTTLSRRVEDAVAKGELEKGTCVINGKEANWYRPKKK